MIKLFLKGGSYQEPLKCTICQTKRCNHFVLCFKTKIRKFVIKNHYKRSDNWVWGVTYSKIFLLLYFVCSGPIDSNKRIH